MVSRYLFFCLLLYAETLAAQAFQVVITEVLPDPVPVVGLPAEEFIELTNVSGSTVDLSGWTISNGRTKAVLPGHILLPADSMLIICPYEASELFAVFGRTVGINRFPSLSNEGDTLILADSTGLTIHAMSYSLSLFPEGKKNGGWSLEMINLSTACSLQNNWLTSKSEAGGTPGSTNNVSREPADRNLDLLYAFCADPQQLVLVFSDAINPAVILSPSSFRIDPVIRINTAECIPPFYNQIKLNLAEPLKPGLIYHLQAEKVNGCLSGTEAGNRQVKIALPDQQISGMILNELMWNPPPGGADYAELFNAGNKIIPLQELFFANRNSSNEPASIRPILNTPRYLYPGEYIVCTTNKNWLLKQYLVRDPEQVLELPSLPSWPDVKGVALLLDRDLHILDELAYNEDWQFDLVRNKEGVALERKDPAKPTQDKMNWYSAAMQVGYGTPGYANSQQPNSNDRNRIWIDSEIFTPDGDGANDQCEIRYRFGESGYVCTIQIYNREGQLKRKLINNGLCGYDGQFWWDGKDDKGNPMSTNIYFVIVDVFQLTGKTKRYRMPVTLASLRR
jgi:hypothetical protein